MDKNNNALTMGLGKPHNFFQLRHCVRRFFWNLKYAWQRIKRGYSDYDLLDFDTYLERVLSQGLKDFAKRSTGFPNGYETYEEWIKDLNDIAELVTKFNPDNCIDWDKDDDWDWKDWEKADDESTVARELVFDWMKMHWGSLWD